MGLAPLLYATHIVRPAEIVSVLRFLKPNLLACRFAGLAAFGLGTISLAPPVAMVGGEETTTTRALTLSHSFCHCPLTSAGQWINSERERSISRKKKKEGEEDFVRMSWEENTEDGATKSDRSLPYIFRSPVTPFTSVTR